MNTARTVVPGEKLGALDEVQPGPGAYARAGCVFASVVGQIQLVHAAPSPSADPAVPPPAQRPTVSVLGKRTRAAVPTVGVLVTGRVKRICSKAAVVAIMLVGTVPVREDFEGVIRVENVRATERDKVLIHKCFRPNDVVRAEVISLGEARSYILSTAKNELGVVAATSAAGAAMVPISWQELQCPLTRAIENRKVCQVSDSNKTT